MLPGDSLRHARFVRFAERGHGNRLLRAIDRDGFQRRFRTQGVHD